VSEIETILGLLVAVTLLAMAAGTLRIPYPILLVFGGLLLAVIPAVPNVELAPELVFLLFLPPLLYIAGFDSSLREIRAQVRAILSLAVGLVLATTLAVAFVAHWVMPELGWPTAFVLGAIVSPPDAVAATALLSGLGVPRRLVTLLEGESLFNDATALVAYQAALVAAATASFSPLEATGRFVVAGVGGVLVGLAVGLAIARLRHRLHDPAVEISVSLLTPFAAYLPAERLGVSGVLATATAGLCVGWWAPRIMASDTRLRSRAVWEMLVFLLNGLVFILIGMQLSAILGGIERELLVQALEIALAVVLTVIGVRLTWVFAASYLKWIGLRRLRQAAERPDPRGTLVVGWAGMRGVVSLAAALALPLDTPGRNLLIFVTFCVILATLVGQGLSLPTIIRAVGVGGEMDGERDEVRARTAATEAAAAKIEQLADEWPTHLPLIEALRAQYGHRISHLTEHPAQDGVVLTSEQSTAADQEVLEHRKIRRAVIDAERAAVLDLRDRGLIDDHAWRTVERDIDLEELRMEA
jgi:monovalent cation/hydrogen antiporter